MLVVSRDVISFMPFKAVAETDNPARLEVIVCRCGEWEYAHKYWLSPCRGPQRTNADVRRHGALIYAKFESVVAGLGEEGRLNDHIARVRGLDVFLPDACEFTVRLAKAWRLAGYSRWATFCMHCRQNEWTPGNVPEGPLAWPMFWDRWRRNRYGKWR